MHSTDVSSSSAGAVAGILNRTAVPFFLFAAVLLGLLTASRYFILPRFALVEVSGERYDADGIASYKTTLEAQIAEKEDERKEHVLSVYDSRYYFLKNERARQLPLDRVRSMISSQAKLVADEASAEILLDAMTYDLVAKKVTIRGDVRGASTRSMTVLASFVESLRTSGLVKDIEMPRFIRAEDPGIGLHSPFSFAIFLQ